MRALSLQVSPLRYAVGRTLGRVTDAALYGPLGALRPVERELPDLPGPRWVRCRVSACGICGTDLGTITFSGSPSLEPFASFPAVPGHEILARVEEVGDGVRRVEPGRRVVVDPVLSCAIRGWPEAPCASCGGGLPATCERAGEQGRIDIGGEPLAPGMMAGFHRQLPGGWGEEILVHEDQLHVVPEGLADRRAVLVEPLSIGVHAALRTPLDVPTILVIGSGPIALGTIWALRVLGYRGELLGQAKREHEQRLARRLGADEVVAPGAEARDALLQTGARSYEPMLGPEVYAGGGFPLIFDCVGSGATLSQGLRWAAPGGRIVLLGCAAKIPDLDLTWIWSRELRIRGFVAYGEETWRGERLHTFAVTQRLLEESPAPVQDMVTHVFPLAQYRDALRAASDHGRSGAVKVLLEP